MLEDVVFVVQDYLLWLKRRTGIFCFSVGALFFLPVVRLNMMYMILLFTTVPGCTTVCRAHTMKFTDSLSCCCNNCDECALQGNVVDFTLCATCLPIVPGVTSRDYNFPECRRTGCLRMTLIFFCGSNAK